MTILLQPMLWSQPTYTTFYCKGGAIANDHTNWNTSPTGDGTDLAVFEGDGNTYIIQNGQTVSNISNWIITGSGAKLVVDTGATLEVPYLINVHYFEVKNGGTYIHSIVSTEGNGLTSDIPGTLARIFASNSNETFLKWANGGSIPVALPYTVDWGNLRIDVASLGGNWKQDGFDYGRIYGDLIIENTGGESNEFILGGTSHIEGTLSVNGGVLNLSNSSAGLTNIDIRAYEGVNHIGGIIKTSGSDSVQVLMGNNNKPAYFYSIGGGSFVNTNINYFTYSERTLLVLSSDLPIAAYRRLVSQGNLNFGIYALKGAGSVYLDQRIFIGSPDGITASGSTGNIQVTGDRVYNTGSSFVYNGSSAQYTGDGLPATIDSLIINNSNGVTLTANVSIHDRLVLQQGNLNTGAYTITANNVSRTDGHVIGNLKKTTVYGSQTYDVGTANGYTPVTAVLTGTDDFTVKTTGSRHPSAGANSLNMYWTLTAGSNITSADLTFQYLAGDVVGTESNYDLARWSGSTWETQAITINTTAHTATKNGITDFSDWTLGESGALPVELSVLKAIVSNSVATLVWSTATEVNNYGFEVERRKIQNVEGRSEKVEWQKIGFVKGSGNSNTPSEYSYADEKLAAGNYEYRLKQIDLNGSFKYSQNVEISVAVPKEFSLNQNYPNPFNPATTIQYDIPNVGTQYIVSLRVFDIVGREVATLVNETKEAGSYEVNFNASQLASGVYLYKLQVGNFTSVKKLMLMK
jgi:hypothetical protein